MTHRETSRTAVSGSGNIHNTEQHVTAFNQGKKEEGNVLFNDARNTFYFTVIWRQTYGKGPLR